MIGAGLRECIALPQEGFTQSWLYPLVLDGNMTSRNLHNFEMNWSRFVHRESSVEACPTAAVNFSTATAKRLSTSMSATSSMARWVRIKFLLSFALINDIKRDTIPFWIMLLSLAHRSLLYKTRFIFKIPVNCIFAVTWFCISHHWAINFQKKNLQKINLQKMWNFT